MNRVDWKIRAGHMKDMVALPMPAILGWDVSGVVQAIGKSVTTFSVGDHVYSRPDIARPETYAELVAVRASEVARKPGTISHIEAGLSGNIVGAEFALADIGKAHQLRE